MTTLYDQCKVECDKLADQGFTGISEVSKHFRIAAEMDRALGYENAAARWMRGAGFPSMQAERRARAWLVQNAPSREQVSQAEMELPSGALFLVACDQSKAERARKVLALLGCEVVDV